MTDKNDANASSDKRKQAIRGVADIQKLRESGGDIDDE